MTGFTLWWTFKEKDLKKKKNKIKTTKLSAQNELLASLLQLHVTTVRRGQGHVEMCCSLSQRAETSHRHCGCMAFTKCFQPLESEATQVQKSEVTYCLIGLFLKQNLTESAAADDDDDDDNDEKLSTRDGWRCFFFHRPWIRICGWWGTGAERRVFLPGLAEGQACVRWLGWGTVEEEKGAES